MYVFCQYLMLFVDWRRNYLIHILFLAGIAFSVFVTDASGQTASQRVDACLQMQILLGGDLGRCVHPVQASGSGHVQEQQGGNPIQTSLGSTQSNMVINQLASNSLFEERLQSLVQTSKLDHNLYFKIGTSDLQVASIKKLEKLAALLHSPLMGKTCLKMVGHTDASGDAIVNKRISLARAEIARDYLVRQLAPLTVPIVVDGRGETELLPGVAKGAAKNRRVEIWARPCQ